MQHLQGVLLPANVPAHAQEEPHEPGATETRRQGEEGGQHAGPHDLLLREEQDGEIPPGTADQEGVGEWSGIYKKN